MANSGISSISFGMQVPTKNVIGLAANRSLWKGQFDDNIKVIHELIGHKTDLYDRGCMGCALTFDSVSRVINKQFPQLASVIEELNGLKKLVTEEGNVTPEYNKELNKILKKADKQFGKKLDVSTADIEVAVGVTDSPISAICAGLL